MHPTVLFLTALGQSFAAMALYGDNHPMREQTTARLHAALLAALRDGHTLRFSFIDNEVIVGSRPLTELRGWEWGVRLSQVGVQRLEIEPLPTPTPADVVALVAAMRARILQPDATPETWSRAGMRYGPVAVPTNEGVIEGHRTASVAEALEISGLAAEIEAVDYIHGEVRVGHDIPMAEADAIVRGLALTMRREQGLLLPLLDIRSYDEYTSTHCCNVSMLSIGLSEQLGLSPSDVRAIGTAALLHDIGKVRVRQELLVKPGKLTPAERLEIEEHPVHGARILSERGLGNSLAATVAYEHHIWFNGKGGYPRFAYPRRTHYASRIVHVCDIYDALCAKRPYRDPWPREKALGLLESIMGVELDPSIASAFMTMARSATEQRHFLTQEAVA